MLLLLPLAACQGGEPPDATFDGAGQRTRRPRPERRTPRRPDRDRAARRHLGRRARGPAGRRGGRRGDHRGRHRVRDPRLDLAARRCRVDLRDPRRGDPRDDAWQVSWTPALVAPDLVEGEALAIGSLPAERGQVLGAGDATIVGPRPVVRLGLDKTQAESGQWTASARAIARELDLGVGDYVARVEAAGEKAFVEALVLRAEDAATTLTPPTATSPAPSRLEDEVPLAPTREFAAPSSARSARRPPRSSRTRTAPSSPATSSGSPGSRRGTTSSCGAPPAYGSAPPGARPTARCSSRRRPRAAAAPHPRPGPAAEGRAGPGRHRPGQRPGRDPSLDAGTSSRRPTDPATTGSTPRRSGSTPPGSTFKVVSSLALLRAGLTPETPVACDATVVSTARPSRTTTTTPPRASAGSPCARPSPTRATPPSSPSATARRRCPRRGGRVARPGDRPRPRVPGLLRPGPAARGETEKAADLIGQGTVLASPMAMAAVAASVSAGTTVTPGSSSTTRSRRRRAEPLTRRGRAAPRPHAGGGHRGLGELPGRPARRGRRQDRHRRVRQ